MKAQRRIRGKRTEAGIALLISIFILLLISVVAIALIVSSGTETALAGNYRSSTGVYYAAMAGLEEARSRLVSKNPSYFRTTSPGFLPAPGTPLALGAPVYMINPLSSETVAPWDLASTYPDTQFNQEFLSSGYSVPPSPPWTNSVWNTPPLNSLSFPGPLYKWVRINAISETSLGVQVAPYDGHSADPTQPIFYDGSQLNVSNTGSQVLEITSFAALPNGSQKLVQYLVAGNTLTLPPFPAAVTLVGNNVDYTGPNTNAWFVNGNDTISLGSCAPGASVYAVGYSNSSDPSRANINQGTFTGHAGNYTGQGGAPSLGAIGGSIPANFLTASGLNSIAQTIIQNGLYDKIIPRNATGADLPPGMSPSNLMTVVVQGDLNLTNSFHSQGYGLLLVTGNLTYDPDSSWYGIVLVIGKGTVTGYTGRPSDNGQFVGAMFAAKTIGSPVPGTNLPDSGDNNVELPDTTGSTMGGVGIYYSSCWIKAATPSGIYKVLSFHEISQ
jgi:hypothetical protein